ncbi:MAG: chromosome segregation protein SMC [Cyclobacteriaceae bacterium]|nr:chromosome segregation protein SMC [Cyclobacteriaceae bacterium HetDA_MAG_MS6]
MQLTRLELKGFKSFADKVTINFDEGITGIVGPNGCGKSNIVDSIRWVLGEQKTRVLRSEKMENVIFNGTKNRKQTQSAEVSLTFNNTKNLIPTEYSQVTITRRYYRTGESEYLLNGVSCRLKDITNLFLDTGIASNSYAIIELKMVDDLLNDKDNSRRALFEEAAGISKFKIRKKETLRKLNDTDADLDRVEDLLFEIEKNLKSLERQAKQAKRYYEIKEEYKGSSVALAQKTIATQQEVQTNIEEQITQQNDQKSSLSTQLTEKEARLEKYKSELVSKEKLLSSRQKTLNEHVHKIRQYESDKKIKNERQRFLQDKVQNLKEQISQDKQSNERASFSLKSLDKEKETAQTILHEVSRRLDLLKEDYDGQKNKTTEATEILNELNQKLVSQRESLFQHSKDLEIKEIQLKTLKQELVKTSQDSTEHSANLQEFDGKLKEIEEQKAHLQNQFNQVKEGEEKNNEQIASFQQKADLLRDEINQINRKLDAKQNEFNLTKSLVENLEGFPEAIKFLKKKTNWKDAPLLSDILTCAEEYRICIENYLEPYMNYYVVDKTEDALSAVNLLSESSQGKANFFILERLAQFQSSSTSIVTQARPATEVVEFDDKYHRLISYLLHDVYIHEGQLDHEAQEEVTLISKSGKMIKRSFSITGGSVGLFEGKRIGRAKNLEKLEVEIKSLTKKQQVTEKNLNENQALVTQYQTASQATLQEELKEKLVQLNETYVSISTKQEQFTSLLTSNTTRKEDIVEQIEILEREIEELRPLHGRESNTLGDLEEQVGERKQELEALNELLAQKSTAFNEENVLFHRQQNKLSSINQEIGYKDEAFQNSLERIEKNLEELQITEKDLNELAKKSADNDNDLVGMYDEKESIEQGVNEAEREYYQNRASIDEEEKLLREIQHQRERVDQVLMEWQNKLNETKLQLNSIKERLSVEFNIDADALNEEIAEDFINKSEEELKNVVEKLNQRMENMGPINPMAMEAYEEIKERHDFITEQKEDLIKAKESLLMTIQEIDEVAKETFLKAFEQIKGHFIQVFRTLFTDEDDCDIRLTDPENPLDSSIDIIAKPKGKRPLTINQLSGGEKTLTATSLLFAIYLIKPAPFCIFDEVDAPLDDANIDKFNQIIRKFSNESQFIIVTHNKRTMASTDVIYGITMVEQGISRVVPVDLRELA